jgi:aminoglycoside phosphotransferase (APT) family kinase protein
MTDLQQCLPPSLRGPTTAITRIASGLSGAAVHRVDAGDRAFVLKLARPDESLEHWRRNLATRRAAAGAGLTPDVVHADETHRATVTTFVADRGFPMFWLNPATHDAAVAALGDTLRRLHALPPGDARPLDAHRLLADVASRLADVPFPSFVADAMRLLLVDPPPPAERAAVLSHNDVNPSNLLYDGERILLVDWDVSGLNEPFYDLACIAVFLLMDDDTCRQLLAAHDCAPVTELPARFVYDRRLAAILCGAMMLHLARGRGFVVAADQTLAATPSLAEFYMRMRTGAANPGTPEGGWAFGLSLVKEGLAR